MPLDNLHSPNIANDSCNASIVAVFGLLGTVSDANLSTISPMVIPVSRAAFLHPSVVLFAAMIFNGSCLSVISSQ